MTSPVPIFLSLLTKNNLTSNDLYKSIYDIILNLPRETIIYPGHDYGPKMCISIGENISLSPLLQADDEDDFIKRMDDYEANRTIGS